MNKPAEKPAAPPKPVHPTHPVHPAHPAHPVHPVTPAELRKAERERKARLEEAGEAILEFLAVPNEDGTMSKTLDAIRAAVPMSEEDLSVVLGELDSQGFVERSTANDILVWTRRPVPNTKPIIIP